MSCRPPLPDPSRRTVLATGSALGGALLTSGLTTPASAAEQADQVDETTTSLQDPWRSVLDDADMVWQRMPTDLVRGPVPRQRLPRLRHLRRARRATTAVRFNVQHREVQDHRPEFGSLFGLARLPIGHFTLEPVGAITGVDWRLRPARRRADRHDHHRQGHASRSARSGPQRPLGPRRRGRHRARASGGSAGCSTRPRRSARAPPSKPLPDGYQGNPPAGSPTTTGVERRRPAAAGGRPARHRVAGADRGPGADTVRARRALLPADHGRWTGRSGRCAPRPRLPVRRAGRRPTAPGGTRYYRKSFLSVPDARIQSFYWIQLYKVASAARRRRARDGDQRPLAGADARGPPPGGTSTSSWSTG